MVRLLTDRRVLAAAVVIGGLLALALWPRAIEVEVADVARGALTLFVEEEGMTRIRDRFVVSAPVAGRVMRIELEHGDRVTRGDVVARVRPSTPPLLDARTRAEAQAAVEGARASLGRARAEEQRARAALEHAQQEMIRARHLVEAGATSRQEFEARAAEAQLTQEAVNAAAFAVHSASAELQRATASLAGARETGGEIVTITAPVDGVVLKRLLESERIITAGEPLLEIGDPSRLEIVADLLSTDAVRVRAGAPATIEQWGEETVLHATVRRVEPAGFTKISALGVEEQRVNVVLDFDDWSKACAALGDAYRVEVRIVTWDTPSVLKVPTSALFRDGGRWAVYVASGDRAQGTVVELGHQTGREAEVTSGLAEGMQVIVHPSDLMKNGSRIKRRPSL